MSSKNMLVAVRIRPLSTKELDNGNVSCCTVLNNQVVAIRKEGLAGRYLRSQQGSLNEYAFDAAFDEGATQLEIYENTTKPFISSVLNGYNVTVFAYGATGAGKTHTMMGNTRYDASAENCDAGIIPNALIDIFCFFADNQSRKQPGENWQVIVSFMEVYNEQVYDLLEPTGKALSLREDQDRGVIVSGIAERDADSPSMVLELLRQGNQNRKTESTMANAVSSRSHAILQITVRHSRRTESGSPTFVDTKLSLIDLAGSERASATNNRGARLQEGANINKSLLALANCINALAGNSHTNSTKRTNVKYRDSKLTHLLKNSLEGKCKLIMIANINPSNHTFEDSNNTLKYANRAKEIKVNASMVTEQTKESTWVEREAFLREENSRLRCRVLELEDELHELKHLLGGEGILPLTKSNQSPSLEWCQSPRISMDNTVLAIEDKMPFVDDYDRQLSPVENIKLSPSKSSKTFQQPLLSRSLSCLPVHSQYSKSSNHQHRVSSVGAVVFTGGSDYDEEEENHRRIDKHYYENQIDRLAKIATEQQQRLDVLLVEKTNKSNATTTKDTSSSSSSSSSEGNIAADKPNKENAVDQTDRKHLLLPAQVPVPPLTSLPIYPTRRALVDRTEEIIARQLHQINIPASQVANAISNLKNKMDFNLDVDVSKSLQKRKYLSSLHDQKEGQVEVEVELVDKQPFASFPAKKKVKSPIMQYQDENSFANILSDSMLEEGLHDTDCNNSRISAHHSDMRRISKGQLKKIQISRSSIGSNSHRRSLSRLRHNTGQGGPPLVFDDLLGVDSTCSMKSLQTTSSTRRASLTTSAAVASAIANILPILNATSAPTRESTRRNSTVQSTPMEVCLHPTPSDSCINQQPFTTANASTVNRPLEQSGGYQTRLKLKQATVEDNYTTVKKINKSVSKRESVQSKVSAEVASRRQSKSKRKRSGLPKVRLLRDL